MVWLLLMSVVSVACVYVAETVEWLKKRPVATGVMFGSVAVLSECFAVWTNNEYLLSGLTALLPVATSLFFNPVSGLVTALISASSYFILLGTGVPGCLCFYCSISTIAICICSIFTRKLFFHDQRPRLLVLMISLVYYAVFHILFYALCGYLTPDIVLNDIYNGFLPFLIGVLIPGMLIGIFLKILRPQQAGQQYKEVWILLAMDCSLLVIIGIAIFMGDIQTRMTLAQDFCDTNYSLKRQANYLLRRAASSILSQHEDLKAYSSEQLRKLAHDNDLDEINIIDNTGHVITSSNPDYEKKQDELRHDIVNFSQYQESPFSKISMIETEFWPEPGSVIPSKIVKTEWRGSTFYNPVKNGMFYRSAAPFKDTDTKIKTPVPGTLDSFKVAIGDTVKAGQVLAVIKDAKAETEIKAKTDGTVKSFHCEPNAVLKAGQVIIDIAEKSGYAEFGVSQDRLLRDFDTLVIPLLKERPISESGFFIFCNPDNIISLPVSRNPDMCNRSLFDFGDKEKLANIQEVKPQLIQFNGTLCRCIKMSIIDGWTIYGMLPLSEYGSHNLALACVCNILLLVFLFGVQYMRHRSSHLSNQVATLEREKKKHHQNDLMLVQEIQRSELRENVSETKYTMINSYIKAAEEVGGDFYDYFATKDKKLVCLIADVSGEGLPAAFYMLKAKLAIREIVNENTDLEQSIAEVNKR